MAELILALSLTGIIVWLVLVRKYALVRPFSIFPFTWLTSVAAFRIVRLFVAPNDISEIISWRTFFNAWGNVNTLLGIFFLTGIAGVVLVKEDRLWK